MKELTKAEEQIMQAIWKIGHGFAQDIIHSLSEPRPAYTTILTIVRILEKKGFVAHDTFGKSHRYYPLVTKKEYTSSLLKNLVHHYFDNSFKSMVSFFAENRNISVEELEEIKKMINSGS